MTCKRNLQSLTFVCIMQNCEWLCSQSRLLFIKHAGFSVKHDVSNLLLHRLPARAHAILASCQDSFPVTVFSLLLCRGFRFFFMFCFAVNIFDISITGRKYMMSFYCGNDVHILLHALPVYQKRKLWI